MQAQGAIAGVLTVKLNLASKLLSTVSHRLKLHKKGHLANSILNHPLFLLLIHFAIGEAKMIFAHFIPQSGPGYKIQQLQASDSLCCRPTVYVITTERPIEHNVSIVYLCSR